LAPKRTPPETTIAIKEFGGRAAFSKLVSVRMLEASVSVKNADQRVKPPVVYFQRVKHCHKQSVSWVPGETKSPQSPILALVATTVWNEQ